MSSNAKGIFELAQARILTSHADKVGITAALFVTAIFWPANARFRPPEILSVNAEPAFVRVL